jgi:ectoine hydroxylase-related dioxygenase (phytanoyl-CoA dioxygenase family)
MADKKVTKEDTNSDDEEVIDLCDDHNYQVLSAVFETESGKNVADILNKLQKDIHIIADNSSKIQKDIHLLASSISKLINMSLEQNK